MKVTSLTLKEYIEEPEYKNKYISFYETEQDICKIISYDHKSTLEEYKLILDKFIPFKKSQVYKLEYGVVKHYFLYIEKDQLAYSPAYI